MGRAGGGVRPNKSNKDDLAINRILGEELAASVLEFSDLGRVHHANLAVSPIEPPLVGLRIVQAQGQAFDMPGSGAIDLDRVQLRAAVPNLVADPSSVKFDPVRGTCYLNPA